MSTHILLCSQPLVYFYASILILVFIKYYMVVCKHTLLYTDSYMLYSGCIQDSYVLS